MNSDQTHPRILGAAFLLQAVTSLVSGAILLQPLIVAGDITATMANIAEHPGQMWAAILGDIVTAIGIALLGALLYATLRKQNRTVALVALGLYLVEAAMLAASRFALFGLLHISQESALAGHPAYMQTLGNLFYELQRVGYGLHIAPFAAGAILFYYLLYKSAYIPRVLSLWGLITVPLVLIGTLLSVVGYEVPMLVYLPYAPFEFVVGAWLLIKGFRAGSETG
jgi:hypothetical protein